MTKKEKIVLTKGRKKTSMARVRIKKGVKSIKINGRPLEIYETELAKKVIEEPFMLAERVLGEKALDELDFDINVKGGGIMGQAYACRTAIGKALLEWTGSEDLRKMFVEYDRTLIIDDVRLKEPKKYLKKGARARPIKSYR